MLVILLKVKYSHFDTVYLHVLLFIVLKHMCEIEETKHLCFCESLCLYICVNAVMCFIFSCLVVLLSIKWTASWFCLYPIITDHYSRQTHKSTNTDIVAQ